MLLPPAKACLISLKVQKCRNQEMLIVYAVDTGNIDLTWVRVLFCLFEAFLLTFFLRQVYQGDIWYCQIKSFVAFGSEASISPLNSCKSAYSYLVLNHFQHAPILPEDVTNPWGLNLCIWGMYNGR